MNSSQTNDLNNTSELACKFHPLESAINYCPHCDVQFCESCSDESSVRHGRRSSELDSLPRCFICEGALEPIKGSQKIEPFWSRLGEIYKYPLSGEAISAIVGVSAITALIGNSSFFLLIPVVGMMLYSFACLRETAKGKLTAPGYDACFSGSIAPVFYLLIAFVVFGVWLYFAFSRFGVGLGIAVLVFLVLAIPAVVILIAVEEKLLPALNPAQLFEVMRSTGISYFVMLLFLVIMMSSVAAIGAVIGTDADSFIGIFVQALISNYYSVVTYHIMGYLVYQNQDELGFEGTADSEAFKVSERSDTERSKAQLDLLIKAGYYDKAQKLALRKLDEPSASMWDWSRAFSLICAASPTASRDTKAKKFFFDYARQLEQHGDLDTLAQAYVELKKQLPEFVIDNHEQRLFIAKSLFDTGQYSHVANILHSFHQQSDDRALVTRALELLKDSFASIPGREKLAKQYAILYELQCKKTPV